MLKDLERCSTKCWLKRNEEDEKRVHFVQKHIFILVIAFYFVDKIYFRSTRGDPFQHTYFINGFVIIFWKCISMYYYFSRTRMTTYYERSTRGGLFRIRQYIWSYSVAKWKRAGIKLEYTQSTVVKLDLLKCIHNGW